MYVSVAAECSSSGTPIQLPLVHALGPKSANPVDERFHARLETCTCFRFFIPYLRDIANLQTVVSPYKRDTKWHIKGILSDTSSASTCQARLCYRKHRTLQQHTCFRAMIHLQPRIRRPHATPHLQRHPRRPCCRQEDPFPSCSIFGRPSFVDHPRTLLSSWD